MKTKHSSTYTVSYAGLTHTVVAPSLQKACRQAFKYWCSTGAIKRQPQSDPDGGWKGVTVDGDFRFRSIEDVKAESFLPA